MTVALSLLTQVSTLLSSIIAISTGLTKEKTKKSFNQIEILQSVIIYLLFTVIFVILLLSPLLLPLVRLSYVFLIPVCLMLVLSVPISVISGFLNGKKLLVKLGITALLSAIAQFFLSVSIGFTTKSGVAALVAMATGQFVSIIAIYFIFKKDNLPHIKSIIHHRLADIANPSMRKIVKFTIFSSLGVMLINILQILDLLAVQNRAMDEKMYTDLYIVSRVVFFAGTIFVWPFIASTELHNFKINRIHFSKLVIILTTMTLAAGLLLVIFGTTVTNLLFGTSYSQSTYSSTGSLSILYKYQYILLYALVLFFTLIRSYTAVYLPVLVALLSFTFTYFLPSNSTTNELLVGLNAIAFIGLSTGILLFLKRPKSSSNLL